MRKLSQRELLEEAGFLDMVRGFGKAAARGALAATKGIIRTISPTGAKILSSAADAVGATAANIIGSSPSIALETFLKRPENKNIFKTYKIIKETNLPNGDRSIELTGEFIHPQTFAISNITTNIVFRRVDRGGISPEKWKCISKFNNQTGQFSIGSTPPATAPATTATPTPTPATTATPTPATPTPATAPATTAANGRQLSQTPSAIRSRNARAAARAAAP